MQRLRARGRRAQVEKRNVTIADEDDWNPARAD